MVFQLYLHFNTARYVHTHVIESEERRWHILRTQPIKALPKGNHVDLQSAYNFIVPCTALPPSPTSRNERRLTQPNVHLIRVTARRCNEQISVVFHFPWRALNPTFC